MEQLPPIPWDDDRVDPVVEARAARYVDLDSLDRYHIMHRIERGMQGQNIGLSTTCPYVDKYTYGTHQGRYYLVGADSGVGKCLAKGTKVIMYDGSMKKVEDVCNGDLLMGPDSRPRIVSDTTHGTEQMYWVHQKRGMSYRVNESHILSLVYTRNPQWTTTINPGQGYIKKSLRKRTYTKLKTYEPKLVNMSVRDYLKVPDKTRYQGWRPDRILFTQREELRVDPYFVGAWLGDGTSSELSITTIDRELIDYLSEFAKRWNLKVKPAGADKSSITYRLSGIVRGSNAVSSILFNQYKLKGDKHIPDDYIYGSVETRLQLLAGLIDTDGYVNHKNNHVEITQKRKRLADQITFLARSLGFYVNCNEKIATMKRGDGSIYTCPVYRVSFFHDDSIPCKVERKKAHKTSEQFRNTGIRVVKDVVDEYYGFCVDKDGLFLLEDFTVTHNTTVVDFLYVINAWLQARFAKRKLYIIYYSFEIGREQKILRWISYFVYALYGVSLPSDYIDGKINGVMLTKEHLKMVRYATVWVEELMGDIDFFEDPIHPTQMLHDVVEQHYEKIGSVLRDKPSEGKKRGRIKAWTPNDPMAMTIVVCDHMALIQPEQGLDTKQTMDLWSKYIVILRNLFGITYVGVQQFNTEMTSYHRMQKKGDGLIAPQRIDFGDSRYTFRDADVVWGLVKPAIYDVDTYMGYDCKELKEYFIMAHLMKNRYGAFHKALPLFIDPIAGHLKGLPIPAVDIALEPFLKEVKRIETAVQFFTPKAD